MVDLEKEIVQMLEWLGAYGRDPEGGVTRLLYTKEWLDAQKALESWMIQEGFDTYFDEIGNLFGGLRGSRYGNETVLTGSHVDTVCNGGLYDGQYGIIAALMAVKYLKEKYGEPLRNLQVVSIAEEEGSRFPYTFWGAKNIVGTAKREEVEGITGFDGACFASAMKTCGFDFPRESAGMRRDIKAFVEVHVEQGSVLEKEKRSIGVVTGIVGQCRYKVEVSGQANHAGTTPMGYRRDALHAASLMILDIYRRALDYGDPLVATIGKIEVKPSVANVVPGHALFTLDIRHPDKEALARFCAEITDSLQAIADEREVGLAVDKWMDACPVPMDARIVEVIRRQCEQQGLNYKLMHSGAGHDSQILAPYIPTAMIFVPSRDGVSHNPAEFTEPRDLAEGLKSLIGTLYELAYQE
ncbi:allantoate deiminase [Brevibacillus sp. B_LB10_24]|uniref:allantoate deiminase n=1 Tax=Brevibacillus sp. B_LB10_24 TaxID=3380645 RepID=UPI0038BC805E